MYEEAGLSSLERLVGREVDSVCFVRDYVQIVFDDGIVLTCYTLPIVTVSEQAFSFGVLGYRDRLGDLIGKSVQSVAERRQEELSIVFEGGDNVSVSLRTESFTSVEAAMLHRPGGDIFDVWRDE